MDASFKRNIGTPQARGENYDELEERNKRYTNLPPKRLGTNLHQTHCGHGYRPQDYYHVYPGVYIDEVYGNQSLLGASPREIRTVIQMRHIKKRTGGYGV